MTGEERLSRVLARWLLIGAWTGVLVTCLALGFQVASAGRIQGPWPFVLGPRFEGPWPALHAMAWSGMALLILTPVVSLVVLGSVLVARRRLGLLLTVVGLLLVLALGLVLGLAGARP